MRYVLSQYWLNACYVVEFPCNISDFHLIVLAQDCWVLTTSLPMICCDVNNTSFAILLTRTERPFVEAKEAFHPSSGKLPHHKLSLQDNHTHFRKDREKYFDYVTCNHVSLTYFVRGLQEKHDKILRS